MRIYLLISIIMALLTGCSELVDKKDICVKDTARKTITVWLIGDSTMADYSKFPRHKESDNPITGWGQVFQQFMEGDYLKEIKDFVKADQVVVDDRAIGGRTTRSFFEEGRWRQVYNSLQPGDIVMIQFGHNDAAIKIPERYANRGIPEFVDLGYREYLRLYVSQTREKGGIPILLTPVARNYLWKDGILTNVHGKFPDSVKMVVEEMDALLIDLNQLSMDSFTSKGKEYVNEKYFMNLPPGKFKSIPDGLKDNTHFQTEGAIEVARLVYSGLKEIAKKQKKGTH
ncbi:MAG: rhamnogalacturonan acetylesterase [Sedimentisphaerales bacterium]|nr:rhamnogalacturonan acetylesterase [Sedimentisphaerales bacterium]